MGKLAKEISRDKDYHYSVDAFINEKDGNPEISNNNPNGMDIVVDYDDNIVGNNKSEESAIVTIHGAGHRAKRIIDSKDSYGSHGHLDQGVMEQGNGLARDYAKGGVDKVLAPNCCASENFKGNEVYIKAMMERYGTNEAKGNYGKDK